MYIRWQKRKRANSKFGPSWDENGKRVQDSHWSAVLVENARINGKPKQCHIAYIVGFTETQITIPIQRCHLWDYITEQLDRLHNQIPATERKKIEAAIIEKVPRPTPAEYKNLARDFAQNIGWEYLTEKQQIALQDETEQWKNGKGELVENIQQALGDGPVVICSFCGKSSEHVGDMLTATAGNVCSKCLDHFVGIIAEQEGKT